MTKESNKNLPAYLEKMNAEILELNFKTESLRMSFNPCLLYTSPSPRDGW